MGALLKLILCFYLLSLIFSMFCGLLRFIIDVAKWHKQEKKVKIIKSAERSEYNGRINNDRGTGDNDTRSYTGTGDTGTGDNDTGTGDSGRTALEF